MAGAGQVTLFCVHGRDKLSLTVPLEGAKLCVDCLSLCLVLAISFCVLELGLMTFLDIAQSESTPLMILVNHWRRKLVSSSKEGQVSYSLLLQMAHLQNRLATRRDL